MHNTTTRRSPRALATVGLLSCMSLVAACGEDAAGTPPSDAGGADAIALDPESMRGVDVDLGDLSDAERQVLLRAKGRRWTVVTAAELNDYLSGEPDRETWLYVWNADGGVEALRAFQRAADAGASAGARLAVGVLSAGVTDDLLVALRASQVPYPAFVIRPEVAAGIESGPLVPGGVHVTTGGLDRVAYASLAEAFAR